MELAFKADFAIVKLGRRYSRKSNFKGTARNFNPCMSGAATITVAEVEELVEAGTLDPNQIHILEYSCNVFFKDQNMKKN
jgi:3-oxoacid CoA-transferase subunit A